MNAEKEIGKHVIATLPDVLYLFELNSEQFLPSVSRFFQSCQCLSSTSLHAVIKSTPVIIRISIILSFISTIRKAK